MTSFEKPTNELVESVIPKLGAPQLEAYFFSKLENPCWIEPLEAHGAFKYPTPAEAQEGGGFRYPHWPPSGYLARMAGRFPEQVARLLAGISTDNATIMGDMVNAALVMPPEIAVKLVPNISKAAKSGFLWIYYRHACELCRMLAEAKQFEAALDLAGSLFSVQQKGQDSGLTNRDQYWYKEGLNLVLPALASGRPKQFLEMLSSWLTELIGAKGHRNSRPEFDHSYAWRPAIEEHEQNHDYELAGAMVGFLRHGIELAIGSGVLSLDEALTIISQYPFAVFKRMRLHLISSFGERDPNLVRSTIVEKVYFDDYQYKHEYAMLLGKWFGLLTIEEQQKWFSWVDDGPDMDGFEERFKERTGREASTQDRNNRVDWWTLEKLYLVRDHLLAARKGKYQKLLEEKGVPELADMNVKSTTQWGNKSPMTVEELNQLDFREAVERVASWQPGSDQAYRGPDVEGLAGVFGQLVAKNPEAASREARCLIGKTAIYVRKFINGMGEAIKSNKVVDLGAVLDLCDWVVAQPAGVGSVPYESEVSLTDERWQWTRDEISSLIPLLLRAKGYPSTTYSQDLRERLASLVQTLQKDRSDSYVVVGGIQDPRTTDYLNRAINSPRGKAVGAALEYARWVRLHFAGEGAKQGSAPNGFGAMPEVARILEWHIADDNRTVEALAVIGANMGLLYWLDKTWLASHAGELFQLTSIEASADDVEGWAAWNAFLVWVQPHVEFYKMFVAQFEYAIKHAASYGSSGGGHTSPVNRLGEHLVILFGRGDLNPEPDRGPLYEFFNNASPDARRQVVDFVGESLRGEGAVPEPAIARFMSLWDVYWTVWGPVDAKTAPNARLFGSWFASKKFPPQWAMGKLEEFMRIVPAPEPDYAVVEYLSETAHLDIALAMRILTQITHADRDGWRVHGWKDSAANILKTALGSSPEVRDQARALINYLGRRGHLEFGELLST